MKPYTSSKKQHSQYSDNSQINAQNSISVYYRIPYKAHCPPPPPKKNFFSIKPPSLNRPVVLYTGGSIDIELIMVCPLLQGEEDLFKSQNDPFKSDLPSSGETNGARVSNGE